MHAVNSNRPRMNHCGTPNGTDVGDELSLPIRTSCFLSAKHDLCQSGAEPDAEFVGDSTHQNAMVNSVLNDAVKTSSIYAEFEHTRSHDLGDASVMICLITSIGGALEDESSDVKPRLLLLS